MKLCEAHPLLVAGLFLLPATAFAEPGGGTLPQAPGDPVLERVSQASARQDWAAAQALLKDAIARAPDNAEYHNLYAYAIRKGEKPDMQLVFTHYRKALALDPRHRGAHEYIGEAYLMVNDLPKAKEHLAQLDRLCFLPCEEYTHLKQAIARHEKR
ncbi:MAG TPA: hypothetical protein VK043_13560 [Burkholderiales bacterium]|nr:hypothetical protein [Burkholderiales bacterium]